MKTLERDLGASSHTYVYDRMNTPVGDIVMVATDKGLAAIAFSDTENDWVDHLPWRFQGVPMRRDRRALAPAREWLIDYFAGRPVGFENFPMPLDLDGPDFMAKVWKALTKIPYGKTLSYGEIASRLGSPRGSRAVGAANGRNPVAVVVPCHRVIGADGSLTGFGGGLDRKEYLLDLESS